MRSLALSIALIFAGLSTLWAQPTERDYKDRLSSVVSSLDTASSADLSELTIGRRIRDRIANISLLWNRQERPSGPIRSEFFDATKLLYEIAEDESLKDATKDRLIADLVEAMTKNLARLSEPYADPADLRILDHHYSVDGKFKKFLSAVTARLVWLLAAMGRDIGTGFLPVTHHQDGHWSLSIPRGMPVFGEDVVRSHLLKRVAKDMKRVFGDVLKNPGGHEDSVAALEAINSGALASVESLKYSQIHYMTQAVYLALTLWFVINPTPELALERTQGSAVASSILYAALGGGLIYLRRVTSGMGFAATIREIMKRAKVPSYERRGTAAGIRDFITGRPCSNVPRQLKMSRR